MPIVRRSPDEIDRARLRRGLAAARLRTEAEIEAEAAEDGNGWSVVDVARAVPVRLAPTQAEIRALRARLGLSQARFAHRFGFSVDAVQQYEQGRRVPSGPAATLLRVIAADPEAVLRALHPPRPRG